MKATGPTFAQYVNGVRMEPEGMDLHGLGRQTITFDRITAEWRDGSWHISLRLGDRKIWTIDTPRVYP